MSHQPERNEKECLNCGTSVAGRYCHNCGQENIVTHQNFLGLVKHFVFDIFHYDGKFLDTFRYLIKRPGFVPKDYLRGRRNSYLDPIRMYLFTSAVFFIIFFAVKDPSKGIGTASQGSTMTRNERIEGANKIAHQINSGSTDLQLHRQLAYLLDTSYRLDLIKDSSLHASDTAFFLSVRNSRYVMTPIKAGKNDDIRVYSKANWFNKKLKSGMTTLKQKHGDDSEAMLGDISSSFIHKFPYMLFISLPFFALILKLLYVRKKMYYSDHAVFTLYHYVFMFILLLFYFLSQAVIKWFGGDESSIPQVVVFLIAAIYLYISMSRFYGQGRSKTLFKFFLLSIMGLILMMILAFVFILFSFLQF